MWGERRRRWRSAVRWCGGSLQESGIANGLGRSAGGGGLVQGRSRIEQPFFPFPLFYFSVVSWAAKIGCSPRSTRELPACLLIHRSRLRSIFGHRKSSEKIKIAWWTAKFGESRETHAKPLPIFFSTTGCGREIWWVTVTIKRTPCLSWLPTGRGHEKFSLTANFPRKCCTWVFSLRKYFLLANFFIFLKRTKLKTHLILPIFELECLSQGFSETYLNDRPCCPSLMSYLWSFWSCHLFVFSL